MEPFNLNIWRSDLDILCRHIHVDSRSIIEPQTLFIALNEGHKFLEEAHKRGAIAAIVDKNYVGTSPLFLIRVDNPLHALQEIAALYRKTLKGQVIALIGSEGKTFTKACLQHILGKKAFSSPESFNSQLGVALSLLQCEKEREIILLEAAVSLPGEMERLEKMLSPDGVILTSVTSKYARNFDGRQKEEFLLMAKNLKPGALFILPTNDLVRREKSYYLLKGHKISLAHPFPHAEKVLEISFKAALKLGVAEDSCIHALQTFDPAPQQTEVWSSSWGTTFINAPSCQSSFALAKALQKLQMLSHKGKKYILFFGMSLNASDYQRMAQEVEASAIDKIYFIEKEAPFKPSCAHLFFTDKTDACRDLYSHLSRDDTVLLIGSEKHHLDELTSTLMDMIGDSRLSIDASAIEHNLAEIRSHLPEKRIMVMLKAFGYGTDSLLLAKFLCQFGIDIFGVAHVDEAILLKRKGIKGSFFIINAAIHEAEKAALWDCEVAVSSSDLIQALQKAGQKLQKKIKVHLHVDTGMGRFGCLKKAALNLAHEIASCDHLEFEGLMTHFACADMPEEDVFTANQITLFKNILDQLPIKPRFIHAANSGATVRNLFPEGNMIRLGLALFGLKNSSLMPTIDTLRCALTLTTKIYGINTLEKGDTVSYGKTYTESRPHARMAIVPLGYFDGLHRHYSSKGHLLIAGQKAPLVGRICMDFMMIDITDHTETHMGDEVLVFGQDAHGYFLAPEELAETGGTITHELITCLGPRIQRIFIAD